MDDGTTKTNPWDAVCEAMVAHVLHALQVIYDDFNVSLERWLNDMVSHPIAEDWRGEVAAFVDETERKGLRILPASVRVIEALIESRIAGTGQFARFGPAKRTSATAVTSQPRLTVVASEAERQPAETKAQPAPVGYPDIPTGHRGPAVNAERLFDEKVASAKGHLNVLEQLLKAAGEKLDSAKPDEKVDLDYEAAMVDKHLFLYGEDIAVVRDLWLRFNLSGDANSRLIASDQSDVARTAGVCQARTGGAGATADWCDRARLNQQNQANDQLADQLRGIEITGEVAGIAAGIGLFWQVFKQSGKWVAVKTLAATAATTGGLAAVDYGVDRGLRSAGAGETTIRGADWPLPSSPLYCCIGPPKRPLRKSRQRHNRRRLPHPQARRRRTGPGDGSVQGSGDLGKNAATSAAKHLLREKEVVLAVVKDGKIIASGPSSLSHAELVARQLGGRLPEGARVVTVVKENGVITVAELKGRSRQCSARAARCDRRSTSILSIAKGPRRWPQTSGQNMREKSRRRSIA